MILIVGLIDVFPLMLIGVGANLRMLAGHCLILIVVANALWIVQARLSKTRRDQPLAYLSLGATLIVVVCYPLALALFFRILSAVAR